ncbi:hypothetical protein LXM94_16060 [Rhizobium sp. TRM95111]|uniref:hypothetical protein n=1 Tax=Rhizobium alarense TaxID=2846851 RepID=UPI001F3577EF|nr:hypothetical protein [Rhizobium alarense]MCF3641488.1 hypothetical protein [Rhizobium alarense]
MILYVFTSKNITNIWAGIGARLWAVSDADPNVMAGRRTRATNVLVGQAGLIYCSHPDYKSLTTPFIVTSQPNPKKDEEMVWGEAWKMPFSIHPLGTPRKHWNAHQAARELPFNRDTGKTNVTSVFKAVGTAVFSPIEIGDKDWAMILSRLSDISMV